MIDGVSLDKLVKADEGVDPKLFLLFDEICSNWRRIAELGAKIASALSHAHSLGMVHRDIKPANLILARDGNIWVTDFGLAKLYDDESDLSRTGELIGTPRYMAPEQILGVADERSDIYGVGLTLYELIVKDCPWAKHCFGCRRSNNRRRFWRGRRNRDHCYQQRQWVMGILHQWRLLLAVGWIGIQFVGSSIAFYRSRPIRSQQPKCYNR